MGFEALSRGARLVVFVEQDRVAARCIRQNRELLRAEKNSEILALDLFAALKKLHERSLVFDVIYIDPPYAKTANIATEVLAKLESYALIAPKGIVFVEDASQDQQLVYKSASLKLDDVRSFGAARLYRFNT
jgi:16S rRNA (guanine(966)-N(2))-methyltransferase RsmD